MVAMAGLEDCQVTWVVRFWVLVSVKSPVAVNCCVVPAAIWDWAALPRSTPAAAVTRELGRPADAIAESWGCRGADGQGPPRRHAGGESLTAHRIADGRDGRIRGLPGHLGGEILRAVIRKEPRGRELLRRDLSAICGLAGVTSIETRLLRSR